MVATSYRTLCHFPPSFFCFPSVHYITHRFAQKILEARLMVVDMPIGHLPAWMCDTYLLVAVSGCGSRGAHGHMNPTGVRDTGPETAI
jgi:hypothetical protein